MAFSLALAMDKEEIIVIISSLSSLTIEQMFNTPISTVAICREILSMVFWGTSRVLPILNISLLVQFGSDSARARLSGASRYIYIIATGYESNAGATFVFYAQEKGTMTITVTPVLEEDT